MSYFRKIVRASVRFPYYFYLLVFRPILGTANRFLRAVPVLKEVLSEAEEHLAWLRYARQAKDPGRLTTHLYLEWPLTPKIRYGCGLPRHGRIDEILGRYGTNYADELRRIKCFKTDLVKIAVHGRPKSAEPWWENGMLPAMDGAALYSFLASRKPGLYVEIGSGHSTRFARRAISDHQLPTKIISIDPEPRCAVDPLCDEAIRKPLEAMDPGFFNQLESGDILFVDSSHRCFQNSDVAAIFLEVLPALKKGVLIHFHDIFWPEDYPEKCQGRFYNEQYLLGSYFLSSADQVEVMLANHLVSITPDLKKLADACWQDPCFEGIASAGTSFWMRKV